MRKTGVTISLGLALALPLAVPAVQAANVRKLERQEAKSPTQLGTLGQPAGAPVQGAGTEGGNSEAPLVREEAKSPTRLGTTGQPLHAQHIVAHHHKHHHHKIRHQHKTSC
jgi:hypothetical protein